MNKTLKEKKLDNFNNIIYYRITLRAFVIDKTSSE